MPNEYWHELSAGLQVHLKLVRVHSSTGAFVKSRLGMGGEAVGGSGQDGRDDVGRDRMMETGYDLRLEMKALEILEEWDWSKTWTIGMMKETFRGGSP